MPDQMKTDKNGIVYGIPGMCSGHATLKGHRIEVSNLVGNFYFDHDDLTPEGWIDYMEADWMTPEEVMEVLHYCARKQCVTDGLTCCHCTLNPDEGTDPDDDPFNGWELAEAVLQRLNPA